MPKYSERGIKKKRGGALQFLLILILLAGVSLLALKVFQGYLADEAESLREAVAFVKSEYYFLEMKVDDISGDKIFVTLSYLGLDNEIKAENSYELSGSDVFIESRIAVGTAEGEKRAFVFPFRIYSDSIPPSDGEILTNDYVSEGIPKTYLTSGIPESTKSGMKLIFSYLFDEKTENLNIQFISEVFDTAIHQDQNSPFEKGSVYLFSIHPGGGVEMQEKN